MDNLNEINNNNTVTANHNENGDTRPSIAEKKLTINVKDIDDDDDEDINDINDDDDDEDDDDVDDEDYETFEGENHMDEDFAGYAEIINDNDDNEDDVDDTDECLNESINVELIKILNRSSNEPNEPLNLNLFKLQDQFRLFGNRSDCKNDTEVESINNACLLSPVRASIGEKAPKNHQHLSSENEFDFLETEESGESALKKRLHAANLEILNLNNFISKLSAEISEVRSEATGVQMKYAQLKCDNKELIGQLRRIGAEKEELIKELNNATASRLKSLNEAKRYKADAEAIHREYTQIMSERDQVHKEMEALQEQLCKERDKIKTLVCHNGDIEQLRRDLSEKDKALAELSSRFEKNAATNATSIAVVANGTSQQSSGAFVTANNTVATSSGAESSFETNRNSSSACLYEQTFVTSKDEKILQENENLKHDIRDLLQEIELAKKRRDWAFSERDKMVLERESIRALCDEIRHQRDKAISELAEALRESDELKKQNSVAMRQINLLEENLAMLSEKLNNSKYFYNRKTILVDFEMVENGDLGVEFTGAKVSDDATNEDDDDEAHNDQVNEFLIVTKVSKNGLAYGRLKENDHIFRINNIDIKDANYDQINHLLNTCEGTLSFLLTRQYIDKADATRSQNGDEEEDDLERQPKSARMSHDDANSRNNLLTIHKTTMDDLLLETGVYVSMLKPDSEANDCLDIGDRILSLNGKNLTNRTLNDTLALVRDLSDTCKDFNLVVVKRATGTTGSYLMNEMMPPELDFSKSSLMSSMSLENPIVKTAPRTPLPGQLHANNLNNLTSSTSSLSSTKEEDTAKLVRSNGSSDISIEHNHHQNTVNKFAATEKSIISENDDEDDEFYAVKELDCLLKTEKKLNTWPKNTVERTIMRGTSAAPQASIKMSKGNNESSSSFFKAFLGEIDLFKSRKSATVPPQAHADYFDSDNKIVSSLTSKDYMNFVLGSATKFTPKHTLKQPKIGQIRNIFIEKESTESHSNKQLLGINISEARAASGTGASACVFVSHVMADSVAAKAGIFVGDQLLEICGVNVRSASYREAAKVLTDCACNSLINVIVKYEPSTFKLTKLNETDATPDEMATEVKNEDDEDVLLKQLSQRRSSAPADNPFSLKYVLINNIFNKLQLKVAGGNKANEFFISEIKSNSLLQIGDQILEVNNVSVASFTRERLAFELFYRTEYFNVANSHLKLTVKPSGDSITNLNKLEQLERTEPDSFYVLNMSNRRAKLDYELELNRYDIYHVVNTMPHGFISGYWKANLVHSKKMKAGETAKKKTNGLIPSIGRLVNESPRLKGSSNASLSMESTPPKSNFFSKVIKSNSITSNLLNYSNKSASPAPISLINSSQLTSNSVTTTTTSCASYVAPNEFDDYFYDHHMIDVDLLVDAAVPLAYKLVEMVDVGVKRPCLILGPLSAALIEYLLNDASSDFVQVHEADFGPFDFAKLNEVVKTMSHSRHVLFSFDASNSVAELSQFKRERIYPIVILVKYKSAKILNEFSMSLPTSVERNFDAKTSLKMAKHMFKKASKLEKEFKNSITNTIQITNADFNSNIELIKNVIYHEQKRPIWVPISSENSKKTFENIFV